MTTTSTMTTTVQQITLTSPMKMARSTSKVVLTPLRGAAKGALKLGVAVRNQGNRKLALLSPSSLRKMSRKLSMKGIKVTIDPDRLGSENPPLDLVLTQQMPLKGCATRTRGARFNESVSVYSIPSHRELSRASKRQIWNSIPQRQADAKRNKQEFMSEGRNWRDVFEEADMCLVDGQLVHPYTRAVALGILSGNQKLILIRNPENSARGRKSQFCSVLVTILMNVLFFVFLNMRMTAAFESDSIPIMERVGLLMLGSICYFITEEQSKIWELELIARGE